MRFFSLYELMSKIIMTVDLYMLQYLIKSSVVLDLFDSNFRFLTTGTFDPDFELPLPKTESDVTTTVSVKLDVVNF